MQVSSACTTTSNSPDARPNKPSHQPSLHLFASVHVRYVCIYCIRPRWITTTYSPCSCVRRPSPWGGVDLHKSPPSMTMHATTLSSVDIPFSLCRRPSPWEGLIFTSLLLQRSTELREYRAHTNGYCMLSNCLYTCSLWRRVECGCSVQASCSSGFWCTHADIRQVGIRTYLHNSSRFRDLQQVQTSKSMVVVVGGG